jgi:hypothetical protein
MNPAIRYFGRLALIIGAMIALAVALPKCEGSGSHPFQATNSAQRTVVAKSASAYPIIHDPFPKSWYEQVGQGEPVGLPVRAPWIEYHCKSSIYHPYKGQFFWFSASVQVRCAPQLETPGA